MSYPYDMKDRQDDFGSWAEKTFPKSTERTVMVHFAREVIELVGIDIVREAINYTIEKHNKECFLGSKNPYFPESSKGQIGAESADCTLLLFHLCHKLGLSLNDECRDKFEILKKRTWKEPDAQGVVHHQPTIHNTRAEPQEAPGEAKPEDVTRLPPGELGACSLEVRKM